MGGCGAGMPLARRALSWCGCTASCCHAILQVRRRYIEKMPNFDLCRRSECLPRRMSVKNLAVLVFAWSLISAKTEL